jgi:hypothetical protein
MLAARKGHASILDLYLKKGPTVDEAVHVSAGLMLANFQDVPPAVNVERPLDFLFTASLDRRSRSNTTLVNTAVTSNRLSAYSKQHCRYFGSEVAHMQDYCKDTQATTSSLETECQLIDTNGGDAQSTYLLCACQEASFVSNCAFCIMHQLNSRQSQT